MASHLVIPTASKSDRGVCAEEEGDENAKIFPQRLMEILSDESNHDTIAWLPHGRAFIIVNRQKFANTILPKYFRKAKYTSFTRKLNRWNFTRITRGPELGAYYHEFFQRGNEAMCTQMYCKNERAKFAVSKDTSRTAKEAPAQVNVVKDAPTPQPSVEKCAPAVAKYVEPCKFDLSKDKNGGCGAGGFSKPMMPSVNPAIQARRMLTGTAHEIPHLNRQYDPVTQNILGSTLHALHSGLLSQDYANNIFATQATSPEAYFVMQAQLASLQQHQLQVQQNPQAVAASQSPRRHDFRASAA